MILLDYLLTLVKEDDTICIYDCNNILIPTASLKEILFCQLVPLLTKQVIHTYGYDNVLMIEIDL